MFSAVFLSSFLVSYPFVSELCCRWKQKSSLSRQCIFFVLFTVLGEQASDTHEYLSLHCFHNNHENHCYGLRVQWICNGIKQSLVSKKEHTHTRIQRVDIDILICGTVCSRSHVQSPHTPPAWFTYTHISSVLWQVRWQVVPSGLAIHGHWNSNIIHSIFCSNANYVSRNWYHDKESY